MRPSAQVTEGSESPSSGWHRGARGSSLLTAPASWTLRSSPVSRLEGGRQGPSRPLASTLGLRLGLGASHNPDVQRTPEHPGIPDSLGEALQGGPVFLQVKTPRK